MDYLIDNIDRVQPSEQLSKLNEQKYKKMEEDLNRVYHRFFSPFDFLKTKIDLRIFRLNFVIL
jgi:hypothetical protein